MSTDERTRQKQLANKKSSRDEKKLAMAKHAAAMAFTKRGLEEVGKFPIHECLVPQGLFATGLGTVLISRKINENEVVVGGFLLDVFCLGVKKSFLRVLQFYEYQSTVNSAHRQENFALAEPALARTLIEQCVDYAQNLGFKPHSEYETTRHIFGDIDPKACPEIFTFGSQGKPLFVAGPNDAPKRCQRIIETLEEKCGPGGYDFRLPKSGP
jgi:hypothetical protein